MKLTLIRALRQSQFLHVLLGGIAVAGLIRGQETLRTPLSVCDLFKDLRSHAGKMIAVRGLLQPGMEVSALGDRCESKFVTVFHPFPTAPGMQEITGEYVWPTAIDLAFSTNHRDGEPVDFTTDQDAVERTYMFIKKERAKLAPGNSGEIDTRVTVVGMLRMRPHYDVGANPGGPLLGSGYGHLSTFPAQLVIKTMGDPSVELRTVEPGSKSGPAK